MRPEDTKLCEDEYKARYERAMHYLDQEKECSRLLRDQRDKAWAEVATMSVELKRLAPTGRYKGHGIEHWHERAVMAESRLRKVAEAARGLNAIRADIDGALGYGGMATVS